MYTVSHTALKHNCGVGASLTALQQLTRTAHIVGSCLKLEWHNLLSALYCLFALLKLLRHAVHASDMLCMQHLTLWDVYIDATHHTF